METEKRHEDENNKYEYLYTASELGAWNLQQETKLQKLQVIQTLRRQSRE